MTESVIFAANRGYALTNSRIPLIKRFLAQGWRPVVVTCEDEESESLARLGAEVEPVMFRRGGFSPWAEARAYRELVRIVRKHAPALVQLFHAKPVILGALAARRVLGDDVRVVSTITGGGQAFSSAGLTPRLAAAAYRRALPCSDTVVFQNPDDRDEFVRRGWVTARRSQLIVSSGVDVERFRPTDREGRDQACPTILMLSRLLWSKGIAEFAEVARRVRQRVPDARFVLAGELEADHPDGVPLDWLSARKEIDYLGRLSDVRLALERADIFLFPSTYREGVPRAMLEAAATGLPCVAFDVPGVREAIDDGRTGYLLPEGDVASLAERVLRLVVDNELRHRMGRAARIKVENSFDIEEISDRYFAVYRSLGLGVS